MTDDLFDRPSGVSFTGSSRELRLTQKVMLRHTLSSVFARYGRVLHHGDCVEADAYAHDYARTLGVLIHGHPPDDPKARAWRECDVLHEPLPYLARNRAIVDYAPCLVAAPNSMTERLRSGTWATVRYAKSRRRHVLVVKPDGSVQEFNEER